MDRYPKTITSSRGKAYTSSKEANKDYWIYEEKVGNMNILDSRLEQEKQYRDELWTIYCELETDNCFNTLLISHTDKPVVVIGSWDDEPRLLIGVDNQKINHMICAFNLTLIDNLNVDKKSDNKYMIDFKYDNSVDYQIDITYKG